MSVRLRESLAAPPGGATSSEAAAARSSRRVARWAAVAALLPIPLWFIASASFAPAPAWRAEYRENPDLGGAGVIVHERELSRYWDKQNPTAPGGFRRRAFVARWDACITLREAREIPFMLAVDGDARFAIDGVERLRAQSARGMRATRGDSIHLEPGTHHLHVELEPRDWPSIALLASFDGRAPQAVGSGEVGAGVRTTPPSEGSTPCPAR